MIKCNYHLCTGKEKIFDTCPYCNKTYCSKHIAPKIPSMLDTNGTDDTAWKLNAEYHRNDAHPCGEYQRYRIRFPNGEPTKYDSTINYEKYKNSLNERNDAPSWDPNETNTITVKTKPKPEKTSILQKIKNLFN